MVLSRDPGQPRYYFYVLEPNIPFLAPVLLTATAVVLNMLFILTQSPLRLCWVIILSTHVLVVLLPSTSYSPMIGV